LHYHRPIFQQPRNLSCRFWRSFSIYTSIGLVIIPCQRRFW